MKPTALNLGDEIELTGVPETQGAPPRFLASEVHLLGDRTLVAPVSVTSTQAAGGAFDGRLVEVRGTLSSRQIDADDGVTLHLQDAEQTFRVVGRGGLSPSKYENWVSGSELRIRGICRVGPWQQQGGAFTVMLQAMDDVEVLSGPPWWSPSRMPWYVLLLLVLIALGVYLYLELERWKMRAILSERERLAHEMHDTLAQSFAGVGFHLQGVRNSFRAGAMNMPAVMEKLDVACDLVTRAHRDASAEIAALHPDAEDVLETLVRCTQAMLEMSLPPLKLVRERMPRAISTPVRDVLFQVGREAIMNTLRHSRATEIVLSLRYDSRHVVLDVSDNGIGFCYQEHASDFGIRTMHRRCEKVGATLSIRTAPGNGTCVRVQAPYSLRLTLADWLRSHRVLARATQATTPLRSRRNER